MERRGVTLAELLIAAAIFATLLALGMTVWTTSHHYSVQLEERFDLLQRAQVALATLARDIQQARRLTYPAAGGTETALGLLDANGDVIQIQFEQVPGKPGVLTRSVTRTPPPVPVPLLSGVLDVRFRVPPAVRSRDPALVNITLTLAGQSTGKPIHLMTSARLRAPIAACPIERDF